MIFDLPLFAIFGSGNRNLVKRLHCQSFAVAAYSVYKLFSSYSLSKAELCGTNATEMKREMYCNETVERKKFILKEFYFVVHKLAPSSESESHMNEFAPHLTPS